MLCLKLDGKRRKEQFGVALVPLICGPLRGHGRGCGEEWRGIGEGGRGATESLARLHPRRFRKGSNYITTGMRKRGEAVLSIGVDGVEVRGWAYVLSAHLRRRLLTRGSIRARLVCGREGRGAVVMGCGCGVDGLDGVRLVSVGCGLAPGKFSHRHPRLHT